MNTTPMRYAGDLITIALYIRITDVMGNLTVLVEIFTLEDTILGVDAILSPYPISSRITDGEDERDCQYFICEPASQNYDDYNITSLSYYINISEGSLCNGIGDCANKIDECLLTCPHACMCNVVSNDN